MATATCACATADALCGTPEMSHAEGQTDDNTSDVNGVGSGDLFGLYAAVGQIVARKYYCEFCAGRRDAAMAEAKHGPRAFPMAAVNHQGMICGCAEWIIDTAQDALSCPNTQLRNAGGGEAPQTL